MRSINLLTILLVLALGVQAADGQLQMEQIVLETLDGLEIDAHRIANGNDAALIYCHRLLSSKDSFDLNGFGNALLRKFDIITLDFRGHGKSEGYSTCGGDEVLDLLAAVQYARQVGYRKIAVLGIGMGGTVAIREAALFKNVDAVVVVSPLGQSERFKPWSWGMTSRVSAKVDYIKIPVRIFHGTRLGGRYLTGSPIHLVDRVSPIPLLIVHGDDSKYLNFRQTESLYEKAKEPKRFLVLPQPEYRDGLLNKKSAETIADWLEEVIPRESQQNKPIPIREIEITGDVILLEKVTREQRQWSIAPAIKIDSFDYFGGLSFSLNKYRPGALRVFGSSLAGLEYHNLIYRFNVEKSWLSDRALSTRFEFEQFINRRGVLDYYFARQEARERGGGVGLSYKVTDNAIIHSDSFRKKFAPVGGDEALPVGEGIINSLAFRLENRGQILQKGDSSLNWRSQAFVETATKSIDGDYDYTLLQLNLYPQLILSPIHVLGFGIHWGTSWGDLPPQKMFSLGGIKTMPGYGYDAFLGEHIFLMRAKYDLRFGKWLGNTSRWEPLAVSLLFDTGDAQMKEKSLEFGAPRLEAGIEFSYASVIKIAIFKSLGKERVAPYIYFGWYPNIFLLKS